MITSPACAAWLMAATVVAADLPLEEAAWSPLDDRGRQALLPTEVRPSGDFARGYLVGSLVATSRDRLAGSVVRQREGSALDGGLAVGLTTGSSDGGSWGPEAMRNSVYLRGGSDAGATADGEATVAVGAAALGSWAGGPLGAWADLGWSHQRDTLVHLELMGFLSHLVIERDREVRVFRVGLCLRWPGVPLARTPGDDPWSVAFAIDAIHSDAFGDRQDTVGADLVVGWRFQDHLVLEGRCGGVAETLSAAGDEDGAITAAIGLATVW